MTNQAVKAAQEAVKMSEELDIRCLCSNFEENETSISELYFVAFIGVVLTKQDFVKL